MWRRDADTRPAVRDHVFAVAHSPNRTLVPEQWQRGRKTCTQVGEEDEKRGCAPDMGVHRIQSEEQYKGRRGTIEGVPKETGAEPEEQSAAEGATGREVMWM